MSVLRTALLTIIAVGHQLSFTPPAVPETNDQRHGTLLTAFVERTSIAMLTFSKTCIWTATAVEALLTLEPHNPLLTTLCPSSSPPVGALHPALLAGVALSTAGTALRRACFRALGRLFTFAHTTRAAHTLVGAGPYAHARHPAYTAAALVKLGGALGVAAPGGWLHACAGAGAMWVAWAYAAWCVLEVVGLAVRAGMEDASLRARFGGEWEAYAQRVPWRFVPYVL